MAYLWIDATDVEVRAAGRIVFVALIVTVPASANCGNEVLRPAVDPSEAGPS
jgi:hypothetical protein